MKGKLLENIVLVFGLLVIGSAVFLMYIDAEGIVAQRVNLIFSVGFIIYIAYSYLLSRNLNREIRELEKHVQNLKEEVARQKETIAQRDGTIAEKENVINQMQTEVQKLQTDLNEKEAALKTAQSEVASLREAAQKASEN